MSDMNEHLKKVAAHHDWWSETYDSDYFDNFGLYHRITLDNIKRFLPRQKDMPILDAGGGTGIWSIELAKMGYRIILTDISQEMLKKAEEKISAMGLTNQVEITISNICHMPEFDDGQFAMALCEGDPLSYCGYHHAAVKELVRVVQRGGIIIASVDNRVSALHWLRETEDQEAIQRLLETGEVLMPNPREESCYIVHAFTPEELRELFEANGLTVERTIGKPALAPRLSCFRSESPAVQQWLYDLETMYNSDPAYCPWGGHLEIVGRKR